MSELFFSRKSPPIFFLLLTLARLLKHFTLTTELHSLWQEVSSPFQETSSSSSSLFLECIYHHHNTRRRRRRPTPFYLQGLLSHRVKIIMGFWIKNETVLEKKWLLFHVCGDEEGRVIILTRRPPWKRPFYGMAMMAMVMMIWWWNVSGWCGRIGKCSLSVLVLSAAAAELMFAWRDRWGWSKVEEEAVAMEIVRLEV